MRKPDGAILFELLLALAVFIAAGLTVTAMVRRGTASVRVARDTRYAADLARSALAQIEAGLASPETLVGPVREPEPEGGGFADAPPRPTPWSLEISTEPTRYDGLTAVTVTATKKSQGGGAVLAAFTVTQFVRLRAPEGDRAGGADPLEEIARRAAEQASPAGGER